MTKRTRKVSGPATAVVDSQMVGPVASWTPPIEGPVDFTSSTSGHALDVVITGKSISVVKSGLITPSGEEQMILTATGGGGYPKAQVTATVRARPALVDLTLPELIFSIGQAIDLPFGNVSALSTLLGSSLPSGWIIDDVNDKITGSCGESGTIPFDVWEIPADPSIAPHVTHFVAVISNVTWGISAAAPSDIGGGLKRVVLTIAPQGLTSSATIAYSTGPSASTPIDPADIVGGYKSGTLTFTNDTPQTVTLDILASAISAPSEVLQASIGSPSLGTIAVPTISVTVPALDAVVQRPTMSGQFRMESTITATFPGSTPEQVRWSTADWNNGAPDVNSRTTISGASGNSLLLTAAQRNKALYVERLDAGVWTVSNPSQFPIATFYGNPNPPASAQTMESYFGISGFKAASGGQADIDKMKVLTDGTFGPSSAMTGRQSIPWAMLTKNHRLSFTLPVHGTGYYSRVMMRGTGLVSNNQAAHSYYSLTQQTTGMVLELRVNGATVGSTTIGGSSAIGTDKAGRRWRAAFKDLPNGETRLYLELETGIGTGLYQPSNGTNGTLITTTTFGGTNAILTGTEVALSFPSGVIPVGTDDILIEDIVEPKLVVTDVQFGAPSGGNIQVTVSGTYTGTPAANTKLKLGIKAEGTGSVVSALSVHDSGTYSASGGTWVAKRTYTQSLIEGLYHTGPTFTVEAEYADTSTYTVEYDYPYLMRRKRVRNTPFPVGMNVSFLTSSLNSIITKDLFIGVTWVRSDDQAVIPNENMDPDRNFPLLAPLNAAGSAPLTSLWCKILTGKVIGDLGANSQYYIYYPAEFTLTFPQLINVTVVSNTGALDPGNSNRKYAIIDMAGAKIGRWVTIALAGNFAAVSPSNRNCSVFPVVDPNPGKLYHKQTADDYIAADITAVRFMEPTQTNPVGAGLAYMVQQAKGAKTGAVVGLGIDVLVDFCNGIGADLWINIQILSTPNYWTDIAAYIAANLDPDLDVFVEWTNEPWNTLFPTHLRLLYDGYLSGRWLGPSPSDAVPQPPCPTFSAFGTDDGITDNGNGTGTTTVAITAGNRFLGSLGGTGNRIYEALVDIPAGTVFSGSSGNALPANTPLASVLVSNGPLFTAGAKELAAKYEAVFQVFVDEFEAANVEWRGRVRPVTNTQAGTSIKGSNFTAQYINSYTNGYARSPIDCSAPYWISPPIDKQVIPANVGPDGVRTQFTTTDICASIAEITKVTLNGTTVSPSLYTLSRGADKKVTATFATAPAPGTLAIFINSARTLDNKFMTEVTTDRSSDGNGRRIATRAYTWPTQRNGEMHFEAKIRGQKLYRESYGMYEFLHGDLVKPGLSGSIARNYSIDPRFGMEVKYALTEFQKSGVGGPVMLFADYGDITQPTNIWSVGSYVGDFAATPPVNPAGLGLREYTEAWANGTPSFDIFSQTNPEEGPFTFYIMRSGPLTGTETVNWKLEAGAAPAIVSGDVTGGLPLTGSVTFLGDGQENLIAVTLPFLDNALLDGNRNGKLTITSVSAGTIGYYTSVGRLFTLVDND